MNHLLTTLPRIGVTGNWRHWLHPASDSSSGDSNSKKCSEAAIHPVLLPYASFFGLHVSRLSLVLINMAFIRIIALWIFPFTLSKTDFWELKGFHTPIRRRISGTICGLWDRDSVGRKWPRGWKRSLTIHLICAVWPDGQFLRAVDTDPFCFSKSLRSLYNL